MSSLSSEASRIRSHNQAPGGRVIFFSSSLTQGSAVTPEYLTYVATKGTRSPAFSRLPRTQEALTPPPRAGAVEQMCRTLAKDLGRRGITVNTVSPGPIDTALFREGKPEQALKFIASLHPAGRIGQPDDVSPVVSMLASAEAAWVNGQNILVNGVSARLSGTCRSRSHEICAGLRRVMGGRRMTTERWSPAELYERYESVNSLMHTAFALAPVPRKSFYTPRGRSIRAKRARMQMLKLKPVWGIGNYNVILGLRRARRQLPLPPTHHALLCAPRGGHPSPSADTSRVTRRPSMQ